MIKTTLFSAALILGGLLATAPSHAQSQRMAIPSYVYPGPVWTQIEAAAPEVRIAIINPNSGPGSQIDPSYVKQTNEAQSHGMVVIGYVHTSYGKRSIDDVKKEIGAYYNWYHVDGIFLDEVASGADQLGYYRQCQTAIRAQSPHALIVLNPGNEVDQGYMAIGDIICTFESDYQAYLNSYSAPSWVTKYPARRFWHIVLKATTADEMRKAVALGKQRHAGFMYVTNITDPNPYAALPIYWNEELAALKAK